MPDELFMRIEMRIGFSSPSVISTSSIAAAESEWIPTRPRSNAIRERPCSMSSASATRRMPGLERQRLAVGAVADDPLQHLGDDDGQLGLVVDPVEQLAQLRLREEEAEVLVALAGAPTCRCSA